MKTNRYLASLALMLVVFSLCVHKSHAQFSVTPFATFNKLGPANLFGVGARGEFEGFGRRPSGKTPLYAGVAFGFGSAKGTSYVSAFSSSTSPSQLEIPVTYKISLIHIFAGGKRYFGDGEYEEGGFYGLGDVGFMFIPITTKYDPFNETLYYPTGSSTITGGESKETVSDVMFGLGLGFEKGKDALKFFGEAKVAIPISGVNSRTGTDSPIGLGLALNAGVRFLLGN